MGEAKRKAEQEANRKRYLKGISPSVVFPLLCVVLVICLLVEALMLSDARADAELLRVSLEAVSANAAELKSTNEELKWQVDTLSATLNARSAEDEQKRQEAEEASLPTRYPLSGASAVMKQQLADEAGDKGLYFSVGDGAFVVATGSGSVSSIEETEQGRGIELDHGNGYKSYYSGAGELLVTQGSELDRGDTLMRFDGADNEFSYHIELDGEEIDPMSIMEIDG